MTAEMRQTLARLPYAEKLRRVAELIEFSQRFKAAPSTHRRSTVAERAARADWEKVDAILTRVPAVPPALGDERQT